MKALVLALLLSTAAEARSLKGTYEVPTDNPELQGSNIYPVEFANSGDFMRDGQVRFELPAALVGHPIVYQVSSVQRGEKDLWSGNGIDKMECDVEGREYVCHVVFTAKSITLNEPAIEEALKAQDPTLSEEGMFKFMSISREFADDPIGILRYEVRGKDREESGTEPVQIY